MSGTGSTGVAWSVYIDGLNFYAAVRNRPAEKWVDFLALASRLVPVNDTVSTVKYFTAQILGAAAEDPSAPGRHRLLIDAVRATGVDVIEGRFKVPDRWRSMSSRGSWDDRFRPPLPQSMIQNFGPHFATHQSRPWKVRVQLPEEKFTDVAIAAHLLSDFHRGNCDHAIVVSNDSDLRPAIELVVADGHHVGVVSPQSTVSRDLDQVASWTKPIRSSIIAQCQMPDRVRVPGSNRILHRPLTWK